MSKAAAGNDVQAEDYGSAFCAATNKMLAPHRPRRFIHQAPDTRPLDEKSRSRRRRFFYFRGSAVVVNHLIHDGEPEPGSVRFPKTDEGIKKCRMYRRRYARPVVDYPNFKLVSRRADVHLDFALRLCRRLARVQN